MSVHRRTDTDEGKQRAHGASGLCGKLRRHPRSQRGSLTALLPRQHLHAAPGLFCFSFSVVSVGETGICKSFLGLERLLLWGTESRTWK